MLLLVMDMSRLCLPALKESQGRCYQRSRQKEQAIGQVLKEAFV